MMLQDKNVLREKATGSLSEMFTYPIQAPLV